MEMRWKQIRPKPYCMLFPFIACDTFDGWGLWCSSGPIGTLMSMCGRAVEVELPSNGDEKPSPFNYEGPPRDSLLLCQSLSCTVSMCTICLSVWVTAEWRVPSENMAHNVNARQARGLRKDCSCPSLFPTSSVTAKADVTALSSLKNLFADISSFCHTAEGNWLTDWVTDWGGKCAERQADSNLMDRCIGKHSIIFLFHFFMCCKRNMFSVLLQEYN